MRRSWRALALITGGALLATACAAIAGIDEPTDRSLDSLRDAGADGADGARRGTHADAGDADPVTARSCADVRNAGVNADGTYAIDIDGPGPNPSFSVFCRNMNTPNPTEYLPLPANVEAGQPSANVSGYAGGGAGCPCPAMTLAFLKVRLTLQPLRIEPGDRTFAGLAIEGDGGCAQSNDPLFVYGTAASCLRGGDTSGRGNVDLTGTVFRITLDTVFVPYGYGPAGSSTFSSDRKRVDLTGGGYSGWNEVPTDAGIGLEFAP